MSRAKLKTRAWLPHLAALACVLLCARLALWQVDRAELKEQRLAQWQDMPAIALDPERAPIRFSTITARGQFDQQRHVLLDNQIRNGQAGVHVFTPFRPESSNTIYMVNRGWLPWDRHNNTGPNFTTPSRAVEITARVSDAPRVGLKLGEAAALDPETWPNLMTYYDVERIRDVLGPTVADDILLLAPEHSAHLTGDAWQAVNMGPERHMGYAFQWLSIGLAVAILWLVLSLRKLRSS
ncbi:MAG: SURF1 family protein [Wenzhouxiangella sp.]